MTKKIAHIVEDSTNQSTSEEVCKDATWAIANAPKIAIIGTTPHRDKAPYDDPTWEIWAQATPVPRWNRWFELHDFRREDQNVPRDTPALWAYMKSFDGKNPVYMRQEMIDAYPEIKGAIPYPRDDILARFGTWFMTSTVAWEMALAIATIRDWHQKYDINEGGELALYGIDMADDTEYEHQKPACRHFLNEALAYGIKLTVPDECELLTPGRLYVLGEPSWLEQKLILRQTELSERLKDARALRARLEAEYCAKRDELDHGIARLSGALDEVGHELKNWTR